LRQPGKCAGEQIGPVDAAVGDSGLSLFVPPARSNVLTSQVYNRVNLTGVIEFDPTVMRFPQ
jgi:hypothetical protein